MTMKPNDGRAKAAVVMLSILLVARCALLIVTALLSLHGGDFGDNDLLNISTGLTVVFVLVAMVGAGIAFLSWLYRAYANLHVLHMQYLSYGPSAAIWSWFVPVLNIYYPYQIVRDMWDNVEFMYERLLNQARPDSGRWIVVWWWVWMLSNLLNIVGRDAPEISLLANTLAAISNVIIIYLVREYAKIEGWMYENEEELHDARDERQAKITEAAMMRRMAREQARRTIM